MIDAKIQDLICTMSGAYAAHKEDRTLIEDLLGGTKAVRAKTTLYLPKEEGETTSSYNNRLSRTYLNNFFKHTVNKLSSEVFQKEIAFEESKNDQGKLAIQNIKEFSEDINFEGDDITTFGKENFESGISLGSSLIHVNYPQVPGLEIVGGSHYYKASDGNIKPVTNDERKKNGWRPYFVHYPITSVIRSSERRINGINTLDGLVLRDKVYYESAIYDNMVERLQYFYLEDGQFKYKVWFQKIDEVEWEEVGGGSTGLPIIPICTFSPGKKINMILAELPLQTLAELNIVHYQSDSDQRNILHYARLITFFGRGIDSALNENKIIVGANRVVHSDAEYGDFKVVEPSGKAIESGRKDLENLETKMGMFGLSLLLPKSDRATATEKLIDTSESDSILKSWALMYQSTLRRAYSMIAMYYPESMRKDYLAVPIVNTDLKSIFSAESLNYIVQGVQNDFISPYVAAKEYKRRSIIAKDTDIDEMIEIIEENKEKEASYKNASKESSDSKKEKEDMPDIEDKDKKESSDE